MGPKTKVTRIACGNVNCHIISGEGGAVLVDTGRAAHRERVLEACRPYSVRLLVLTHGHVDHVQNAAFLSERLGVPIAMSWADLPLAADNMAQPLRADTLPGRAVLAFSVRSFRTDSIPPFTPTVFLGEGDALDGWGVPASILAVPGHTDGSIAIDVEGKDLLAGDALMNMFWPTVSMLYHNKAQMLQSARRISGLGERTIHFGHGGAVKNREWVK